MATTALNYNPMAGGYKSDPTRTNQGRSLITFDEKINPNIFAEQREAEMYQARYDQIMAAIQTGKVSPNNLEVLFELGQLADLLELAPVEINGGSNA